MTHVFRVAKLHLGDMAGYITILAGNSVRFMVSLAGVYSHGDVNLISSSFPNPLGIEVFAMNGWYMFYGLVKA